MKTIKTLFVTLGLALGLALPTHAIDAYNGFAVQGSLTGTIVSSAVIPCLANTAGTPVVTMLNVTGDASAVKTRFFIATNVLTVATNGGLGNATNLIVVGTHGTAIVSNTVIILRHLGTDTYERLISGGVTNYAFTNASGDISATLSINRQTNFTAGAQVALVASAVAGDLIYAMTPVGTIPTGAATISLQGPGIFYGKKLNGAPAPCLVETALADSAAATANSINIVAGHFGLVTP